MDARIDALESEIHALRSVRQHQHEVAEEIARLRQQLRLFEGHHDVLPVVVRYPIVDISRFDTGLVAEILSFVGSSGEGTSVQSFWVATARIWSGLVVGRGSCSTGSMLKSE